MRKKKLSPLFRKILNEIPGATLVNLEKKKKSRFMQRLEKIQLDMKNEETGDSGPGKVNLHSRDNPIPWISELDEKPPYYTAVDILVNCEVYENWARVSHGGEVDGKDDFYVNNRNSSVIYNITHWRKRPEVNFPPFYQPMTKEDVFPQPDPDDVRQYTQRDINGIIINLETLKDKHGPFATVGYHTTINETIDVIKLHTEEARKTNRMTAEHISSVVWPPKT